MTALIDRSRFDQRMRARDAKKLSSLCGALGSLRLQRNIIAHATRSSSTESQTFFVLTAHLAVTRLGLSGYWQLFQANCLIAAIHVDTAARFTQHRGSFEKRDFRTCFGRYLRNFPEFEGSLISDSTLSGTSGGHGATPPQFGVIGKSKRKTSTNDCVNG